MMTLWYGTPQADYLIGPSSCQPAAPPRTGSDWRYAIDLLIWLRSSLAHSHSQL